MPPRRTALKVLLPLAGMLLAGCEAFSLDGLTGSSDSDAAAWSDTDPDAADGAGMGFLPPQDAGSSPDAHHGGGPTVDAGGGGMDSGAPGSGATDSGGTTPPEPCADGGIMCGGQCVNPTSDPGNCNGCGNVCATGVCGSSVTETLAAAPTAWTFNGNAFYNSYAPSAELTPPTNYQAGTFIYNDPIVVDAFDVVFDFRIGLQGATRSDGIGFMIEQSGATALGGNGAGLGMAGLTGFGVEFDIYDNGVCGDTNGDHVGVDDLTVCDSMNGNPTSLYATGDLTSTVDLGDGHWHTADVTLAQGAVSVAIDGNSIVSAVPWTNLQSGAPYYFGFAGGTGGLFQADGGPGGYRQEVRNVTVTFPTPRCL